MPLALRCLAENDFTVIEQGHPVGRIRRASERQGEVWMWNITVPVPGGGNGTSPGLDEAKQQFRQSWEPFKTAIGPERLAAALAEAQAARDRSKK